MTDDLHGETALVTGASSGIGRATAAALAAEGANVALTARSEDRIADLAEGLDTEAVAIAADVRDEDAVDSLVEETVDRLGGIDVLVNNAGVGRGSAVEDLSTDEYRQMMETNADGMFFTPEPPCRTSASPAGLRCSSGVSPGSSRARSTRCTRRRSGGPAGSHRASPHRSATTSA